MGKSSNKDFVKLKQEPNRKSQNPSQLAYVIITLVLMVIVSFLQDQFLFSYYSSSEFITRNALVTI